MEEHAAQGSITVLLSYMILQQPRVQILLAEVSCHTIISLKDCPWAINSVLFGDFVNTEDLKIIFYMQ